MMPVWVYIAIGIGMLLAYFFAPPLFWLAVLGIALYIGFRVYRLVRWHMTPHGKRIAHGRLKGYYVQKYGKGEGSSLYKQTVNALRKKGFY